MKQPAKAKIPPISPTQRQRLLSYLEGQPRLGPETVHIDIANTCNLDCITCWNYAPGLTEAKSAAWKAQRMEAEVFQRVLAQVAESGAERIILSGGGEPFTHPRIHDFIAAVKGRGLALTVITNGTLCDFERLAELGVDQLLVNMSSASPETYAAYHPNQPPETFHQLCAGIAATSDRIGINLVQVINAINGDELAAMVDLAHRLGARASFKLGDTPPGTEACRLTPERRAALLTSDIPQAISQAKALGLKHNLPAFADQLANQQPGNGASGAGEPLPCLAGYLYSRVFVDGRIFFCCEHIEVGHIDQGHFADLWLAPAYAAVRQRLRQGKGYPGCRRCGKHDMNYNAARQLAALEQA